MGVHTRHRVSLKAFVVDNKRFNLGKTRLPRQSAATAGLSRQSEATADHKPSPTRHNPSLWKPFLVVSFRGLE
jgi:hypothetical protein